MIYLSILSLVLLVLLLGYVYKTRQLRQQVKYISCKVDEITKNHSDETIKTFTSYKEIQNLMESINEMVIDKQQLDATNKRYQESMRKMLSNISHDLKTPLTVINGYIESIQNNPNLDEDEKRVILSKVQNRSQELIELVNVFFDLVKLESEDHRLELERINVSEICRMTVLAFYELVESKHLEMSIDIPEDDLYILGNEDAVKRILQNLLSNAINYGYEGKVLGITLYSDKDCVMLSVWDQGRGILEKYQEDVFERLYTLEDSRNKDYQGSGLGLTITKRLVENMNGTIGLSSRPYEKTEFTVKLPKLT